MPNIYQKLLLSVFLALALFGFAYPVNAIVDPTATTNNPVGIHILDENDIEDAANLVNSSGGDWGYVTVVIRADERKIDRWQLFFDELRRKHLIPIVRLATTQDGDNWRKPAYEEIDSWIYFLNSLNWVTENRYIIVGNEPNHATEWGGEVNPEEYANYLGTFSKKLKEASDAFFILPAGFDASAPNNKVHMSEQKYLADMLTTNPNVFDHVDGWTSHSYPNPNFSGSETAIGQGSIKTYAWELSLLKSLGVTKDFPVFITETGWAHKVDGEISNYLTVDKIGQKLTSAYETSWNDSRVVAVTPFLLNYTGAPFAVFSWKDINGSFYDFYKTVQDMAKTKGSPEQIVSGKVITILLPEVFDKDGILTGVAYAQNDGQAIWNSSEFTMLTAGDMGFDVSPLTYQSMEPGDRGLVLFRGKNETINPNSEPNEASQSGELSASVPKTGLGDFLKNINQTLTTQIATIKLLGAILAWI